MTRHLPADRRGVKLIWPLSVVLAFALAIAASCGGDDRGLTSIEPPDPPVGIAEMPDISPGPPQQTHMTREKGRWLIRFSTMLANVGVGDFILRATKGPGGWEVAQDVPYSEDGAKVYPTRARLVWGGDGHNHWHVARIAIGRLMPFTSEGPVPPRKGQGVADTKVGFCYYDHSRLAEDAPQNVVYSHEACGKEDDTAIGMGLSWGWMDIYGFKLPGQAIDVTDVPDGKYRLWVNVDTNQWFQEARRDNNVTWVDLEIVTKANGSRDLRNVRTGPPLDLGP